MSNESKINAWRHVFQFGAFMAIFGAILIAAVLSFAPTNELWWKISLGVTVTLASIVLAAFAERRVNELERGEDRTAFG